MLVLAFLIGVVAGLRAMTAPAAVAWVIGPGLAGTWLAFLGYTFTPIALSILALAELVTDQLPSTPSRKVPVQFGARILSGAVSGGAIGLVAGSPIAATALGIVGAVVGTLGGAAVRARLADAFGVDWPAALIEDAVAIVGAVLILSVFAVSRI